MSDNPKDHELAHYGVPGMKWGRRRAVGSDGLVKKSSPTKEYSDDAASAKSSKEKAKSKGVQSLSNDELKSLNERMNLEQNYTRMSSTKVNKGKDVVKQITSGVQTVGELERTVSGIPGIKNIPGANHPSVKLGRKIIRGAAWGADLVDKFNK